MWHTVWSSLPELISAGLKYTIPLAVISFALGLVLALITALIRISQTKGPFLIIKAIFRFYVWLFRSTPLIVQLFIVYFGLPYLTIKGVFPDGIKLEPFTAGIIVFTLNTGAYASETIRATIESIPKGQWEVRSSDRNDTLPDTLLGSSFRKAARVSLPPLSNSFIGLVKDTSLASTITIVEMFEVSQQIATENYQPLVMYCTVVALYAILCTILSFVQSWLEKVTTRYLKPQV